MVDESNGESSESKIGKVLDAIDSVSLKLEDSILEKIENQKVRKNSKPEFQDEDITSTEDTTESIKNEEEESKLSDSNKISIITETFSNIGLFVKKIGKSTMSVMKTVTKHLPYLIPATIIFQTALWLAYLSEGSQSHEFVSSIIQGMGKSSKDITILTTIFGAIGAYLISIDFDHEQSFDTFSLHPDVVDVMVILLVLSSVLYLLKKFQSVYYLFLVFFGSIILRIIHVNDYSFDWIVIILVTVGITGLYSAISLPLYRDKTKLNKNISEIDTSALAIIDDNTEPSYLNTFVDEFGSYMEQAPVSKPSRPSRRSEYELYEWVLLLANLILWPSIVILSVIVGSGSEVYGNTYNMDDNSLMLFGPLLLTLFFFTILYKMDA
ncbi:MAG: hypothetical protein HN401_06245, partial [Euryarchaeota archaeon]|nr:hypothetical protein [Euryarchaeota archaeon]